MARVCIEPESMYEEPDFHAMNRDQLTRFALGTNFSNCTFFFLFVPILEYMVAYVYVKILNEIRYLDVIYLAGASVSSYHATSENDSWNKSFENPRLMQPYKND